MEPNKEATQIAERNLAAELEHEKLAHAELKANFDALTAAHREALAYIDNETRAKLSEDLMQVTKLTVEDINRMSTDQMEDLLKSYRLLKKPVIGVKDAAENAINPRITVGSKFRFTKK